MAQKRYPSDMSDAEWAVVEGLLPAAKPGGRPRKVDLREVLNGIFYVNKSGCQWRMLPKEFGPWETVYYYYNTWRKNGVWAAINGALAERVRVAAGREPTPSVVSVDSQTVKTTARGYNGSKK